VAENISQAPAALSAHAFGGGGSGGDLQEGSAANIVGLGSSLFDDNQPTVSHIIFEKRF
jgi:hypothetical protein